MVNVMQKNPFLADVIAVHLAKVFLKGCLPDLYIGLLLLEVLNLFSTKCNLVAINSSLLCVFRMFRAG